MSTRLIAVTKNFGTDTKDVVANMDYLNFTVMEVDSTLSNIRDAKGIDYCIASMK